jgi:hypothetical protein
VRIADRQGISGAEGSPQPLASTRFDDWARNPAHNLQWHCDWPRETAEKRGADI